MMNKQVDRAAYCRLINIQYFAQNLFKTFDGTRLVFLQCLI